MLPLQHSLESLAQFNQITTTFLTVVRQFTKFIFNLHQLFTSNNNNIHMYAINQSNVHMH